MENEKSFRSYVIENTHFVYKTNFQGDPRRDESYGSKTRKGNIVIPDPEMAHELMDIGLNVKYREPKKPEDEGYYYMAIITNYDGPRAPRVYLVSGDAEPVLLDVESISDVDDAYVTSVNVKFAPFYLKKYSKWVAYVSTMYVFQDVENDPWASMYRKGFNASPEND